MGSAGSLPLAAALALALAGPVRAADVDYLNLIDESRARSLAGKYQLAGWRDPNFDVFDHFNRFKGELTAVVQSAAGIPAESDLQTLDDAKLNRMALNVLMKRAGLLRFLGEDLAFMAKYAMDGGLVQWAALGGDKIEELQQALSERPRRDRRYLMNCAQFVKYAAHLAGLPPDKNKEVPPAPADRKVLVDPYMIGLMDAPSYAGYWRAQADQTQIYRFNAVSMKPGDLLVLYGHTETKNALFESKKAGIWEFIHVEIITREDYENDANTASIGNSGEGPHYSTLLSKKTRMGQWIAESFGHTAFFTKEWTTDYEYVIYRFNERHAVPMTLDTAGMQARTVSSPLAPGASPPPTGSGSPVPIGAGVRERIGGFLENGGSSPFGN